MADKSAYHLQDTSKPELKATKTSDVISRTSKLEHVKIESEPNPIPQTTVASETNTSESKEDKSEAKSADHGSKDSIKEAERIFIGHHQSDKKYSDHEVERIIQQTNWSIEDYYKTIMRPQEFDQMSKDSK